MKKIVLLMAGLLVMWSCKNGSKNDVRQMDDELSQIVPSSEYEKGGLTYLRTANDTVRVDAGYTVVIGFSPDKSLPHVKNEEFSKTYCDNRATVSAYRGDSVILKHQFSKDDFANFLDDNLRRNAILYSVSLVGADSKGIKLEADVCVPHSDEQLALNISLGFDNSITIIRQMPDQDGSDADEEGD